MPRASVTCWPVFVRRVTLWVDLGPSTAPTSGLPDIELSSMRFFSGFATMFVFLFLVRLSDDICDIPIDKITHPERALCSGNSVLKHANLFRVFSVIFMLSLQFMSARALALIGLVLIVYFIFFIIKPKLPVLLHTIILNSTLAIFPIYSSIILYEKISNFHLLLGVFFWLGGLAHDFSHSLIDTNKVTPQELNPINQIDQRLLAIFSLILFLIASTVGAVMAYLSFTGLAFSICLIITTIIIMALEAKLISNPSEEAAKPFYIMGFIYFLLPSLGNTIETVYKGLS